MLAKMTIYKILTNKTLMILWSVVNLFFVAGACNAGFGNLGFGNVGFFNMGFRNSGIANVGTYNIGILNILATRTIGANNILTRDKISIVNIGVNRGK